MKIKSFRVQNYRSIDDSGWIEVEDIACIVGKNEAGKTSLLEIIAGVLRPESGRIILSGRHLFDSDR